ncbi:MAG: tRNA uracil 4-sulfurtransferase ThiI [Limnochordia bacterium]
MENLAADPLGAEYDRVLVRIGEISLKGKNRDQFESRLLQNMRQALADLPKRPIDKTYGRIFVPAQGDAMEVMERLRRVFGIVSLSGVLTVEKDLEEIKATALKLIQNQVGSSSVTFKVETRRTDKNFPVTSMEVSRMVGGHLLANHDGLKVDVHNPQVVVSVEIRQEGAYIYSGRIPGPGGLPLGVGGRGVLLLSGGIDSPVAAWMMMKRGLALRPLHFHSFPFTSDRSKEKVLDICRVLATYAGKFPLTICHFTEIQKAIHKEIPAPMRVTIMRRAMMEIATRLAAKDRALALVTGESLGQVASQTLESIHVISQATHLPILRPLVGMDKGEIVEISRRIGTYDISIRPYEDCCTVFVPKHPETKPRLDQVLEQEKKLPLDELIPQALENLEIIEIP